MGLREKVTLGLIIVVLYQTINSMCMAQSMRENPFDKYVGKKKICTSQMKNERFLEDFRRQNEMNKLPEIEYLSDTFSKGRNIGSIKTSPIDVLSDSDFLNNLRKEKRRKRKLQVIQKPYTRDDQTEYFNNQEPFNYFTEMGLFPDVQYPLTAAEIWTPSYWNPSNNDDQYYKKEDYVYNINKQKNKNVMTFVQPSTKKGNKGIFDEVKKLKEEIPKIPIAKNVTDIKKYKESKQKIIKNKLGTSMVRLLENNVPRTEKPLKLKNTKLKPQKSSSSKIKKKKLESQIKNISETQKVLKKEQNVLNKVISESSQTSRLKSRQFPKERQSIKKTHSCSPDSLVSSCAGLTDENNSDIFISTTNTEPSNFQQLPEFENVIPINTPVEDFTDKNIDVFSPPETISYSSLLTPLPDNVNIGNDPSNIKTNPDFNKMKYSSTDIITNPLIESYAAYPITHELSALQSEIPVLSISFTDDPVRNRILNVLTTDKLSISSLKKNIFNILATEELSSTEEVQEALVSDNHAANHELQLTDSTNKLMPSDLTLPDRHHKDPLSKNSTEPTTNSHRTPTTNTLPDDLNVVTFGTVVHKKSDEILSEISVSNSINSDEIIIKKGESADLIILPEDSVKDVPESIVTQAIADNLREIISNSSTSRSLVDDLREIITLLTVWNSRIDDVDQDHHKTKETELNDNWIEFDPKFSKGATPKSASSETKIENRTKIVSLFESTNDTSSNNRTTKLILSKNSDSLSKSKASTDNSTGIVPLLITSEAPTDDWTVVGTGLDESRKVVFELADDFDSIISEHALSNDVVRVISISALNNDSKEGIVEPTMTVTIKNISENVIPEVALTENIDKVFPDPTSVNNLREIIPESQNNGDLNTVSPEQLLTDDSIGIVSESTINDDSERIILETTSTKDSGEIIIGTAKKYDSESVILKTTLTEDIKEKAFNSPSSSNDSLTINIHNLLDTKEKESIAQKEMNNHNKTIANFTTSDNDTFLGNIAVRPLLLEYSSTSTYSDIPSTLAEEKETEYPISFISTMPISVSTTDNDTIDYSLKVPEPLEAITFADLSKFDNLKVKQTIIDTPSSNIIHEVARTENNSKCALKNSFQYSLDIIADSVHESNEVVPQCELYETMSTDMPEIISDSNINEYAIDSSFFELPTLDDIVSSLVEKNISKISFLSTNISSTNDSFPLHENETQASLTNHLANKHFLHSNESFFEDICPIIEYGTYENQCFRFDKVPQNDLDETVSTTMPEIITSNINEYSIDNSFFELPTVFNFGDIISSLAEENESKPPISFISNYMPSSNNTHPLHENETETLTNLLSEKHFLQNNKSLFEDICPIIEDRPYKNQCSIYDKPDEYNSTKNITETPAGNLLITSVENYNDLSSENPLITPTITDISLTELIMRNMSKNNTTELKNKATSPNDTNFESLLAYNEVPDFSGYNLLLEDDTAHDLFYHISGTTLESAYTFQDDIEYSGDGIIIDEKFSETCPTDGIPYCSPFPDDNIEPNVESLIRRHDASS